MKTLRSPEEPEAARRLFEEHSGPRPVLVFKKSPICPVSFGAEDEFRGWCEAHGGDDVATVIIDVIDERPLARGLTAELGIDHESPQLLWFEAGELRWHGSHGAITRAQLEELWATRSSR